MAREGRERTRLGPRQARRRRDRQDLGLNPAPGQGASPHTQPPPGSWNSGLTLPRPSRQQELVSWAGPGVHATTSRATAGQKGNRHWSPEHEACKRSKTLLPAWGKLAVGLNSPRFLPPQHRCCHTFPSHLCPEGQAECCPHCSDSVHTIFFFVLMRYFSISKRIGNNIIHISTQHPRPPPHLFLISGLKLSVHGSLYLCLCTLKHKSGAINNI